MVLNRIYCGLYFFDFMLQLFQFLHNPSDFVNDCLGVAVHEILLVDGENTTGIKVLSAAVAKLYHLLRLNEEVKNLAVFRVDDFAIL